MPFWGGHRAVAGLSSKPWLQCGISPQTRSLSPSSWRPRHPSNAFFSIQYLHVFIKSQRGILPGSSCRCFRVLAVSVVNGSCLRSPASSRSRGAPGIGAENAPEGSRSCVRGSLSRSGVVLVLVLELLAAVDGLGVAEKRAGRESEHGRGMLASVSSGLGAVWG